MGNIFRNDDISIGQRVDRNTEDIKKLKAGGIITKEDLDKKVDKNEETGTYERVYGVDTAGNQQLYNLASNHNPHTICYRNASGEIEVGTPTKDAHAASKKYVDDAVLNVPKVDLENVDTNIIPKKEASKAYSLGNYYKYWDYIYVGMIQATDKGNSITVNCDIIPYSSTRSLGDTSNKFKDLYVQNIYSDTIDKIKNDIASNTADIITINNNIESLNNDIVVLRNKPINRVLKYQGEYKVEAGRYEMDTNIDGMENGLYLVEMTGDNEVAMSSKACCWMVIDNTLTYIYSTGFGYTGDTQDSGIYYLDCNLNKFYVRGTYFPLRGFETRLRWIKMYKV